MRTGDRVVAALPGQGTWCEAGVYKADALHAITTMPLRSAACLAINPVTALRLLEDFVTLEEGDVVIQNGANSSVGQLIIQIAASRRIRSINVVRDRPNLQELKHQLSELGADVVTTDANLRKDFGEARLPKPKLALNCVGGKASAAIASLLQENGIIVSYGGMSMQPLQVPTGSMIFKNIQAKGFWLSGGSHRRLQDIRDDIDRAAQLFLKGIINSRVQIFDLEEFRSALARPKDNLLATKALLLTAAGRRAIQQESESVQD